MGTMSKTLHSNEYHLLVKWLKKCRLERNLSIRQLASLVGVSHSYIGKVEQAERRLDIVEYIKYCEAMNVDPIKGIKLIQ